MGGDFALHPLLRLPDLRSDVLEVLDVGLASREESWESKDQKDLSCVPSLYFVILPGITYCRPLSPLRLFSSAFALFHLKRSCLAVARPGIMYSVGVGREAGRRMRRKTMYPSTGRS